MENQAKK